MKPPRRPTSAFSLVELLVATAITVVLMGLLLSIFTGVTAAMLGSNTRQEAYREARAALHVLGRDIGTVRPDIGDRWTFHAIPANGEIPSGDQLMLLTLLADNSQPPDQRRSRVARVAYHLDTFNAGDMETVALFRTLSGSADTHERLLMSPTMPIFEDMIANRPNPEPLALHVVGFEARLLNADYVLIDPAIASPGDLHAVEVRLSLLGARPARIYFDPTTAPETRSRILEQNRRVFNLRQHLK